LDRTFSCFCEVAEIIKGKNAFGCGLFGEFKRMSSNDQDCTWEVFALIIFLSFRKHGIGDGIDHIKAALDQKFRGF